MRIVPRWRALDGVHAGATVEFAPGTYLVGEIIRVETSRITFLAHPEGTVLGGCDPDEYEAIEREAIAAEGRLPRHLRTRCGTFELTGRGVRPTPELRALLDTPDADWLGTVESGKLADLVLLDGNPLEDIGSTRRIRAVVLNGRILTRDDLSALRERVLLENHRKATRSPGPKP